MIETVSIIIKGLTAKGKEKMEMKKSVRLALSCLFKIRWWGKIPCPMGIILNCIKDWDTVDEEAIQSKDWGHVSICKESTN